MYKNVHCFGHTAIISHTSLGILDQRFFHSLEHFVFLVSIIIYSHDQTDSVEHSNTHTSYFIPCLNNKIRQMPQVRRFPANNCTHNDIICDPFLSDKQKKGKLIGQSILKRFPMSRIVLNTLVPGCLT